ncbi:SMI1/KNR4 family protein [Actinoplanes sp. CA-131856]
MNPFEPGPSQWTGPPVDDAMVRRAEETLGHRLPPAYVDVLRRQNGGILAKNCYPTDFRTDWAADHFQMDVLLGIGHPEGADTQSAYLIQEWDYPPIGVVIGVTALAGPDTVMLDYTTQGEPAIAYIGEDRVPRRVAETFAHFMAFLVDEDQFEDD